MQVILIKDVENLGYANDIVEVRPGYANNYLIPQGYAKSATASARKVLAEIVNEYAVLRFSHFNCIQNVHHAHVTAFGGNDLADVQR